MLPRKGNSYFFSLIDNATGATEATMVQAAEATSLLQLQYDHKRDQALKLWLKGYSPTYIQGFLVISFTALQQMLSEGRQQLYEVQHDELQALTAERIEALRQLKLEAWERLGLPGAKSPHQYLSIILRAEEDTAKIQGVLAENIRYSGTVTVKRYDFADHYPEAAVEADYRSIDDGEVVSNGPKVESPSVEALVEPNVAVDPVFDAVQWARDFALAQKPLK